MAELDDRQLTYEPVGATRPDQGTWTPPAGFRARESTTRIGHGDSDWSAAAAVISRWAVKTRSGFGVDPVPDHRGFAYGTRP
jgi:uncharacterized protein (UPF0548 family)